VIAIDIGSCGSWVIDRETEGICGIIIAGCPGTGLSWMLPADPIFSNLLRLWTGLYSRIHEVFQVPSYNSIDLAVTEPSRASTSAKAQGRVSFAGLSRPMGRDRSEFFNRLKSDKSPQKTRLFKDFDRDYESIEQNVSRTNNLAPTISSTYPMISSAAQPQSSHTLDQNASTFGMGYSNIGGNTFSSGQFFENPSQQYPFIPPFVFISPGATSMPGRPGAEAAFQTSQFRMPARFRDGSPATPGKNFSRHQSRRDHTASGSEEEEAGTDRNILVANNRRIGGSSNEDPLLTENVSTYSDITTDNQPFETLDQRFQIRKPGFYVEGCVFSLLFIENASQVPIPAQLRNARGSSIDREAYGHMQAFAEWWWSSNETVSVFACQ
jgi:hypothetical protein